MPPWIGEPLDYNGPIAKQSLHFVIFQVDHLSKGYGRKDLFGELAYVN